jgi:hypothetical protein
MYPSASEYCAHCTTQYFTVRNILIRIQVLSTIHASERHCAHRTHEHLNIAHTAPINTPLCAMFPSICEYCAHCITHYCTVRNVPISIQILRTLHPSILHCAQCSHQHPPTAPNARTRIRFLLHTAPTVTHVWIHNGQSTEYENTKGRPLTVIRNYIQALKLRSSLVIKNFDKLLEVLWNFKL